MNMARAEATARGSSRVAAAAFLGIGLHALLLAWSWREPPVAQAPRRAITANVQIEKVVRPPAPTPPVPPPPVRPPLPASSATPPARRERGAHSPAPASQVIARAPAASEPVHMTGFTIVAGDGERSAGGFIAPDGSGDGAAAAPAAPTPATAPASRARPSGPAHRLWSCPWPGEEQAGPARDVRVRIAVRVTANGSAESVNVLDDAASSFARAARRCALGETYRAALDDGGQPIAGTTRPFVVHFQR